MVEPFADELQVMKSLYQEFSKSKDFDIIAIIEQELRDIHELCASREADARQVIKALSGQVRDLETAATYPHHEGLHAERVNALQREIDVARKLIDELDADARLADQQYEAFGEQLRSLAAAASAEASVRHAEELLQQRQLSMYAAITSVKWRKDLPHVVAGHISDCKNKDIRSFNFDPQAMDHFSIVNALWELL